MVTESVRSSLKFTGPPRLDDSAYQQYREADRDRDREPPTGSDVKHV